MTISIRNVIRYKKELTKFFINNPQYKIVHSHLDSLSALPLSIAKKMSVPVRIAHSHTNSFDKNYKEYIRGITKKLIKYFATDFAGCSEESIRFMFGDNINNYQIMNNAIDINKFKFDTQKRKEIRKFLNIDKDTFVLGHVGRFNYPKNHEFLIDMFNEVYKKNKNAVLLLVGDGDGRSVIEEKVKNLKLDNNVKFLGIRSDIHELMQAMDVFVLPSLYEGLGIVLIEAQAAGLPCITSKDVVPNIVKITNNLYFLPLSAGAITWANAINSSRVSFGKRDNAVRSIRNAGYEIKNVSMDLQNYYDSKLFMAQGKTLC